MIISRKRVRRIRIIAVIVVLALAAGGFLLSSELKNRSIRGLMDMPQLGAPSRYRTSAVDAADPAGFTDMDPVEGDYEKAAENDWSILYVKTDLTGIKVYQKATDMIWSSLPEESAIAEEPSESYKKIMRSLLSFEYVELSSTAANVVVNPGYSCEQAAEVTRETITGGLRISFNFTDLNVRLAVDIALDDGSLVVSVPDELIAENEKGADELAETKTELEKEIDNIRQVCEGVNSKLESSSAFKDKESAKKAIDLKIKSCLKILVDLKNQVGTSGFNPNQLEQLYENIDYVIGMTGDVPAIQEKLEDVRARADAIMEKAMLVANTKAIGIIRLSVMPYFGAQSAGAEGYAFYPEGAGAVSYFNKNHPAMSGDMTKGIYTQHGSLPVTYENWGKVAYPVYGINLGQSGFLAIVTEGDSDSNINYNPNKTDRPMANIFGTYCWRQYTTMVNSTGSHTYIYDSLRTRSNWETRYEFLSGENAGYSGMAVKYRDYLLFTGKMKASPLMDNPQMPIGLHYYMGAYNDKQSVVNQYISMTRYSDIMEFSERLSANGIDNVYYLLANWSADPGNSLPAPLKPTPGSGGASGLKELAAMLEEKGNLLAADYEAMWINTSDVPTSVANLATVKAKSQMTRTMDSQRALNPVYVFNLLRNSVLGKLKNYGFNGLYLYGPNANYYDYNKNAPVYRGQCAGVWNLTCAAIQEQLGYTAVEDPNQYTLATTDFIPYLWHDNERALYTDDVVPFSQMVVHGSIAYTSNSFNYFYSDSWERLRMIEYGCAPNYFLTKDTTFKLRNHGITGFNSTVLADWEQRIIDTAKEFNEQFHDVWNVKISSHEKLSDTLSVTRYENGVAVYVNYAAEEAVAGDVTVGPESYRVVR